MQKKILYILLFISAFFLCNIENAKAKEVIDVYKYSTESNLPVEQQVSVLCHLYDDESHLCCIGNDCHVANHKQIGASLDEMQSMVSISNWKNKLYNSANLEGGIPSYEPKNGEFAKYLVATGGNCVGCRNIWAFDNLSDAENMKKKYDEKLSTITPASILKQIDVSTSERLYPLKQAIEELEGSYSFEQCSKKTSDIVDNVQNICIRTVGENQTKIANYKNEYERLANQKKIDVNDSFAKEVSELVEKTENYFYEEHKKLKSVLEGLNSGKTYKEVVNEYYNVPPSNSDVPSSDTSDKCILFGERVDPMLRWAIRLVQIITPVIIIVMSIIDFMGIVFSGEDKNFKAAGSKLVKRLIIGAVIIFLPMLIIFIIDFSGALAPYGIERNQIFCSLF